MGAQTEIRVKHWTAYLSVAFRNFLSISSAGNTLTGCIFLVHYKQKNRSYIVFISALRQNMIIKSLQQEKRYLLWDIAARALRHHQRYTYLL